ncbi:MAG: MFS transporter [Chloroflexi bacterium B3_Chlor]|nr:MAG: MFS transporter [Chloroflexi bacterium B3_Chlor]
MERGSENRSPRPVYRDTNLQIVFGVTLMAVLGVSSITPAFPKIVKELGISPQAVGSLITVFTLPGVLLTAVLGILADQFGRRKILVPALTIFALAGGACAFARDFNLLLTLRFFQGVGAAGLGAINVTIIGDLYSGRERTAAMGCNSSVLSVGTASYPAIGGALATLAWFYPFILPLAAIPVGLAVLFSLRNPEPKNAQDFRQYLSGTWQIIASRQVVGLFAVSTITFIILYGSYLTYFPLFIEDSFAVSPLIIGLVISVSSVATAVTSAQLGRLAKLASERTLITAACILYAVALVAVPFVPNIWLLLIPTVVFGVAQGINMPSLMALLADLAPMEQRGALMSINGMVLRLGQTLGPLVMGAVFVVWGTGGAMYAGAGFALAMLMVVLAILR